MTETSESMETTQATEPVETHQPIYIKAFVILAVLTVIEVVVGSQFEGTMIVVVLALLALAKAAIVAAVFMHVAFEVDTRQIVTFSMLLPLIAVILLTATVTLDYRGY